MRISLLRTNVARLRTFLEMKQPEFAEATGLNIDTLRSVESGRLKLSEQVAATIMQATGVSYEWLMEADPAAPIRARRGGRAYKKSDFELVQSRKIADAPVIAKNEWEEGVLSGFVTCVNLVRVLATAAKAGKFQIAAYRVHRLIETLADEFGLDEEGLTQYLRNSKFKFTNPAGATKELILVVDQTESERSKTTTP